MANAESKPKIFIVHGHDDAPKDALARIIEKNGFEAIILNEQLNKGKTLIEKLEKYTEKVIHAFIIYTACDRGKRRTNFIVSNYRAWRKPSSCNVESSASEKG